MSSNRSVFAICVEALLEAAIGKNVSIRVRTIRHKNGIVHVLRACTGVRSPCIACGPIRKHILQNHSFLYAFVKR